MTYQLPTTTRLGLGGLALLLAVAGTVLPATASPADTARIPTDATVEEQRLDRAAPQEILRRSAFDAFAPRFQRALKDARSYPQAERTVTRHAAELWRRAVDRAQGRGPATGDLGRGDDRPLYWARLALSRELRTWEPRFGLDDEQRKALHTALETSSRGQADIHYPGHRVKRVLVTGFDPFTLDRDARIGNPSGASALALDGTLVQTAEGPTRSRPSSSPYAGRTSPREPSSGPLPGSCPAWTCSPPSARAVRAASTWSAPTAPGAAASPTTRTWRAPGPCPSPTPAHSRSGPPPRSRTDSSPKRTRAASRCTTTPRSPRSRRAAPSR